WHAEISSQARAIVVAVVVAIASVGVTACGGAGPQPRPAPRAGGGDLDKLTWVPYFGEPTILSVGQATAGYPESTILPNLCDSILRLTPDERVVPSLARLAAHPDALTYIFKMRGKARFWDWDPVTAADAVFSLRQS